MASRGKRTLIGCALGCGGLILLAVIAIVSVTVWLNRPGELLQPEQLLGNDTTGYLEWQLRLEDPGTEGFVRKMIQTVQAIPPDGQDEMPGWMTDWIQGKQQKKAESDILKLLPMVIAWTLRPGESPEDDLHLVTLGVEQFSNRLIFGDWIMGFIFKRIPEIRVVSYGKENIYQLPLDEDEGRFVTFFIRRGSIFFTSDADTARQAVDRLGAMEASATPRSGLQQLFIGTADGTLRGALTNSRGELGRIWQLLPIAADDRLDSAEAWSDVRGVTLTGGFRSDGSLDATFEIVGPDAAWATEFYEPVARVLRESLSGIEHPLDVTCAAVGDRVQIKLRITDLSVLLRYWITHGLEIDGDDGKTIRINM